MKTIKINIDSDNRPIIEGLAHYSNSLLRAQYDQCFGAMESILVAQKTEVKYSKEIASDIEYSNNIIVFDGDRGSGKTSCMLSAANMLFEAGEKPYHHKNLSTMVWQKLPMLEPAFFDSERNVLSLVVSRLYDDFINYKDGTSEDDKRNILNQFVKIQKELKCMFEKPEKQDALEYLVNLSVSVSLRDHLHQLIEDYLHYKNNGAQKLLILIDDIDLNQKRAYRMVEELRKYLVLDNCLVMVSVKIEQLADILYQEFWEEYKDKTGDIRSIVKHRVDRYLSKLFPQRNRIHMPQPKDYMHYGLEIESTHASDYNITSGTTVEEAIPDLIYAKTRFLFYNTRKTTSYIVPRNLRNIRQLLKLLMEMKNYQDGDHDNETAINKEVFKHYFFNDWVEQNIPQEHFDFVRDLSQRTNFTAVNYLVREYLSKLAAISDYRKQKNEAIATINHLNVSLGDVFSYLRQAERLNHNYFTPELLFFIKSFYSIRLYEAYDSITPDIIKDEKPPKYYIERKENGIVTDDYQALVAGSVFNSEFENFRMSQELAHLKISQEKLNGLLNSVTSETDRDKKLQKQRLVEFLMLFISYKETEKTDGSSYRTYTYQFYKDLSADSKKDYVANIGSLIYNLSRYEESITRFRSQKEFAPFFAEYDFKQGGSLYNELISMALDERKYRGTRKSDESKLRSICCFRNMEVIEDFYETLKDWSYNPTASYSDSLAAFFKAASEYSIYTYDRDKGDGVMEPYTISFHYFSILANLLASETIKTEFDELFKIDNNNETGSQGNENNGDTTATESQDMPSPPVLPA